MFAGNFAPADWALCQGQLLPISQNETLFQLIGTTYGGDGTSTFQLPDLRGRVPLHMGSGGGANYPIGQLGGTEQVTLTSQQIPSHGHAPAANGSGSTQNGPGNAVWGPATPGPYTSTTPATAMDTHAIGPNTGNQPHDNMLPYLAINYIIALFGVFPSQT